MTTEDQAKTEKVKAAFVAKAGSKFANAESVFKLADTSTVTANEDGTFSGLESVIDQLANDFPWALADETPINSDTEMRKTFFGGAGSRVFAPKPNGVRNDSAVKVTSTKKAAKK